MYRKMLTIDIIQVCLLYSARKESLTYDLKKVSLIRLS